MDKYEPNELFVYMNGGRWELGQVKSECVDGKAYFCWYSRGDTAAITPTENMHKLANAGWTHIEERVDQLEQLCRDMYEFGNIHEEDYADIRVELGQPTFRELMEEIGLLEGSE